MGAASICFKNIEKKKEIYVNSKYNIINKNGIEESLEKRKIYNSNNHEQEKIDQIKIPINHEKVMKFVENEKFSIDGNKNIFQQQITQKDEEIEKLKTEIKKSKDECKKVANDKAIILNENKKLKEQNKTILDENKKSKVEIQKMKESIEKELKDIKKQKEELEKKLADIKKTEILLKSENEKLEKEKKRINDLSVAIQKEKENKHLIDQTTLEKREKEIEKKINLFKNEKNNFEKEKELLDNKNKELMQKESNIQIKEKQLFLRENKIITKEKELTEREKKIIIIEKQTKVVLIGLNNIGATCYMNATLQCFSNTKKLTEYFLSNFKNNDSKKIMSNQYFEVIRNLWDVETENKSYSPYSFKEVLSKENPLFAGIAANDSKDLINFLLERFHQELNVINNLGDINNIFSMKQPDQTNELAMLKEFLEEYTQKFNSPISNLFYGILETKSQCQGCNIIKFNFQVYSFLEFPLQQVNQYYFKLGKRPLITKEGKNPDVSLYECFEYNRKVDIMSGENQMYCNICNKLCNSYYSTLLYSGPNNLIINLNRGKGAVYECRVNFPNQLNIFNFLTYKEGITVYELYAVICHLGPSSMSGHFVAYCRNRIDNQWYLYNDGMVTKCTKQFQYNDGMPYILFYKALCSD